MAAAVQATEQPKRLVSPRAVRGYAAAVARSGQFSNVSNTAMVNRLIDLGYLSDAAYQRGTAHDFHGARALRSVALSGACTHAYAGD